MKSPSNTRSLTATHVALALAVVSLSALTGCAGAALDPTELDPTELDPTELDRAPIAEAQEPTSTEGEAGALGQLQQPIFGSETCRDVYVAVRNFKSDPITVRSIEYYNGTDERWQTENLDDRTLQANGGLEIWVENLENTDSDWIYSVNLLFDHLDHTHDQHFNLEDRRCSEGLIMFDLFVE